MLHKIRVVDIVDATTVDGPGFRTSVYLAGCAHHCPECQNPQTWDADSGQLNDIEALAQALSDKALPVTLTGGDPLFQISETILLCKRLKSLGVHDIWCYTGYTYEQVASSPKLSEILSYINVLVDGRFYKDKADVSLRFKGSSNQRLIDIPASLEAQKPVIWTDTF